VVEVAGPNVNHTLDGEDQKWLVSIKSLLKTIATGARQTTARRDVLTISITW